LGNEVLEVLAGGRPAAFATDSRDRVVFWNAGAAALLGRRAEEAVGRHCYEVLGGRDILGNRSSDASCPLAALSRSGETPAGFELSIPPNGDGGDPATLHCTFLRLPGPRADLFVLGHILDPVDARGRPSRVPAPEIAQGLELSLATVPNHVHHTLEKLQVHSKLEAVSPAFRERWVTGDVPASRPPR